MLFSVFAVATLLSSFPVASSSGVRGQRFLQDDAPPEGDGMMGGGGGMEGTTCSDNVAPGFGRSPANGTCLDSFEIGEAYSYPEVS